MADRGNKQVRGKRQTGLRSQNSYQRNLGDGQEKRAEQLGQSVRTIQRWDQQDREFVLSDALKDARYPNRVIDRILAAVNGPKRTLDESGDFYKRIGTSLREPGDTTDTWYGDELRTYIRTIRAAETLDEFETEFVEFLQKHPDPRGFEVAKWLADNLFGVNS